MHENVMFVKLFSNGVGSSSRIWYVPTVPSVPEWPSDYIKKWERRRIFLVLFLNGLYFYAKQV